MCFVHAPRVPLCAVVSQISFTGYLSIHQNAPAPQTSPSKHVRWGENNSQRIRGYSWIELHESKKDGNKMRRVDQELKGKPGMCISTDVTLSGKTSSCSGIKG